MRKVYLLLACFILITMCGCSEETKDVSKEKDDPIIEKTKEENVTVSSVIEMTDEQFLCSVDEWENRDIKNNLWHFDEDGTGYYTPDGGKKYDITWELSGDYLTFERPLFMDGDIKNIFFDKENVSYTVINSIGEKTVYVPRYSVTE